jgi:hypothetical protein
MVMSHRPQEISFSTTEMAKDFSVSLIFIHSTRHYTMFFFIQLDNLDGLQISLILAEKIKYLWMEMLMEMHLMASTPA